MDIEIPDAKQKRPIHYAAIYGGKDDVVIDLWSVESKKGRMNYCCPPPHTEMLTNGTDIEIPEAKQKKPTYYFAAQQYMDASKEDVWSNCWSMIYGQQKNPCKMTPQHMHQNPWRNFPRIYLLTYLRVKWLRHTSSWITLLLLCNGAPLVLCCEGFNHGSRQVKHDPVNLVTVDYDITLSWQMVWTWRGPFTMQQLWRYGIKLVEVEFDVLWRAKTKSNVAFRHHQTFGNTNHIECLRFVVYKRDDDNLLCRMTSHNQIHMFSPFYLVRSWVFGSLCWEWF